jgi:hypothetical protein
VNVVKLAPSVHVLVWCGCEIHHGPLAPSHPWRPSVPNRPWRAHLPDGPRGVSGARMGSERPQQGRMGPERQCDSFMGPNTLAKTSARYARWREGLLANLKVARSELLQRNVEERVFLAFCKGDAFLVLGESRPPRERLLRAPWRPHKPQTTKAPSAPAESPLIR